jgi:type I restriction enzyme, R subunit
MTMDFLPRHVGSFFRDPSASPGRERETSKARKAVEAGGLSDVGFAVHWQLSRDETLNGAGLDTMVVAREVETLLGKFPNWVENPDEQRRLRLNLYKPVIKFQMSRARPR